MAEGNSPRPATTSITRIARLLAMAAVMVLPQVSIAQASGGLRQEVDALVAAVDALQTRNDQLLVARSTGVRVTSQTADDAAALLAVVRNAERALSKVVIGTASTFSGSGIAGVELEQQKETAPWRNERVRNGWDKAKPWTDGIGSALLGVALALQSPGDRESAKVLGISGASLLAIGSLMRGWFGTDEDEVLKRSSAQVDSLRAVLQQVELSRTAYDDIAIRQARANDYYTRAKGQLATLRGVNERLLKVERSLQQPDANVAAARDELVPVVDDLLAAIAVHETVATFVDDYTGQLVATYDRYMVTYPLLAERLKSARDRVVAFRADYALHVGDAWLADLPALRASLSDWRGELGRE